MILWWIWSEILLSIGLQQNQRNKGTDAQHQYSLGSQYTPVKTMYSSLNTRNKDFDKTLKYHNKTTRRCVSSSLSQRLKNDFLSPIKIYTATGNLYGRVWKDRRMRHPTTSQDYTFVVSPFLKGSPCYFNGRNSDCGLDDLSHIL
jgi:hypothetical protein